MLTVGIHVEKKVVSVKASVDPKATAAERAIMIVLFWLPMFLRDATLVSPKVGTLRTGTDRQTVLLDLAYQLLEYQTDKRRCRFINQY